MMICAANKKQGGQKECRMEERAVNREAYLIRTLRNPLQSHSDAQYRMEKVGDLCSTTFSKVLELQNMLNTKHDIEEWWKQADALLPNIKTIKEAMSGIEPIEYEKH